jgi:hypothetical protein
MRSDIVIVMFSAHTLDASSEVFEVHCPPLLIPLFYVARLTKIVEFQVLKSLNLDKARFRGRSLSPLALNLIEAFCMLPAGPHSAQQGCSH